jgi:hypothetical protein
MEQILYLEVDDDILIVRDRLKRAQAQHVLLVIPQGCKAFTRPLDFRLLRRQAAALKLDVALISGVAKVRDMAIDEGIAIFAKLALGRRTARSSLSWRTEDLPGVEGLRARLKRQQLKWWHWILGPVAVTTVLAALTWSVLMIWPSATVRVIQARESIGVSTWMEASMGVRSVDWDRALMPARVVEIEVVDRGEIETTGITNVADEKAVGNVLFVNATLREVNVPLDTIVSTSAGTPVRFRTIQQATVPPRGRAAVAIEALEGGPGGNVRANLINRVEGGLAASLNVTNEAPTGGGSNDQARRVTHGDKQQVSDLLRVKLIQKAHAEISAELEGEFLPIESLQINEYSIRTNYDHHVDDVSDTLALEMRAVVWGLAISEDTAQEMARRALLKRVRGGFEVLPETVHISRSELVEVDEATGNVRFVMDAVALMQAQVDYGLLRQAIRGQPVDQALSYLRETLPVETEPTLNVHPAWLPRVPLMSFRILIVSGQRSADSLAQVATGQPTSTAPAK